VILPLVAGSGPQSALELGELVAKATFGFGGVLVAGAVVLRRIFAFVAASQSSETFVAATLLVAIGMGVAADELGLSTTTGAFAAGVLLAGSQYRQQIEADIKPFEGILLGIFFMTAGANLDPMLCIQEWPTLVSGIVAFLAAKLGLLFGLGAFAFGLTRAEAIRVALLLAGGGEFAFIVFKLAGDLGLIPDRLGNLLTASVIISMSLTPLLGELADYVGSAVQRVDADQAARVTADELFDVIDADGSGTIEMDELRSYLLGGGYADAMDEGNESFAKLFMMLDLNGDGVISREELRQGYLELIIGEQRDAALQYAMAGGAQATDAASAMAATARDAFIVCGYGEMGQRVCDVLADAEGCAGSDTESLRDMVGLPAEDAWGTQFVAFDRNPSRIAVGLAKQVRVVYGDGASPELLRAAGIEKPRAIVVTYASDKRCLEATQRLRDAFPEVPIYARARTVLDAEPLVRAGATETIVEAVEGAVRIAALLGITQSMANACLRLPLATDDVNDPSAAPNIELPPYPVGELESLAVECGIALSQICQLYEGFAEFDANDKGEVELQAIRQMLVRTSVTKLDEEALGAWMAAADTDGSSSLSFFEFVRVSAQVDTALVGRINLDKEMKA